MVLNITLQQRQAEKLKDINYEKLTKKQSYTRQVGYIN